MDKIEIFLKPERGQQYLWSGFHTVEQQRDVVCNLFAFFCFGFHGTALTGMFLMYWRPFCTCPTPT